MSTLTIETPRLTLILESTEAVLARIEEMPAEDRAQVSPVWLAQLRASAPSPWTHFLTMIDRESGAHVGSCGFKGPPDADGMVEIAYGVDPEQRGRGYAKEGAAALVQFALDHGVRLVRAHTLPDSGASDRVLMSCGFQRVGEVMDPEDGLVQRWEIVAPAPSTN
ncbi:MAG: GNAT family N-acetyltransferase [Gemmatimonadaceae bacterium]|nr:GNAT family N-acetyltransferase [Gemmatimonadaceae bacterium]